MSDTIVLVLFLAAGVAVNAYVALYLTRPWWTTNAGRALMVKAWGNVILIDLALATLIFGEDYPGRAVIRVIGMAAFTTGVWYLLIVLVRTPRYDRSTSTGRPRRTPPPPPTGRPHTPDTPPGPTHGQ